MRHSCLLLATLAAGGDNRSPTQSDAAPIAADASEVGDLPDAACTHGSITAPATINGRTFSPFQRAALAIVFTDDPWPALLIEAEPKPRCACDPPPAGGPGNTLLTMFTDWPIAPGAAKGGDGLFMHVDARTAPTRGTGSMTFTTVTDDLVTGTLTVQFPSDPSPQQIEFEAINCHAL